ncbi:hypothetical protein Tco_1074185, partial [Tanacetum coccineum]
SSEEPIKKSKIVKRSTKKSTKAPAGGVVIRETLEMPLSNKKEKVDVARGKGIELLSDVALTKEAQYKEVQRKSLRDFYKTRPSGSGTVTKTASSAAKIKPSVTNEGTGVKPGVPDVTKEESSERSDEENDSDDKNTQSDSEKGSDSEHETDKNESGSESDQEENEEEDEDDEEEEEDKFVKTLSNDYDDKDKANITDKAEGDEDEEMDFTTSQLYDDVDIRLNEPVQANDETVQKEDIPHTDAEIVSPMDVHIHHEVPSQQTPILFTVHVSFITDSSPVYSTIIPQSLPSFTPPPQQSISTPPPTTEAINHQSALPDFASVFQFNTESQHWKNKLLNSKRMILLKLKITEQVKNQLPQILLEEVSNFAPHESYLAALEHKKYYEGLIKSYELDKTLFSTYDKVYSLKRSQKDKDKDEDPFAGSDQDSDMPQDQEENSGNDDEEPKGKVASKRDWFTKPKRPQEPTYPDWNDGKIPQQGPTQSWLMTLASSADKPSKTFDELISTPINFSAYIMNSLKITNLTQKTLLGPAFRLLKGTRSNYAELEYDFEECYKALSKKLDWENPEGGDYPFDLTKPLPLVMSRNRQKVPVDYFFNNDLKYLQGGISTMTYTTSLTKTKAAQYDLLGIEDMVPNIWSPVKVAYDKHALWGISHWRDQRKSFYGYARGLESRHYVYSTKHILAVNQVEVMRKHGYGYLKEIVVRRADNDLYTFKEGDFPRLRINDIEDMLLLKRVEDLPLRVKSYQKKINVTNLETTKSGIRKRDPYIPYQDPQGFIYVDTLGRNKLMRLDELYKFSDRILTRL